MKFTKEEASLCKQVAEKYRKEVDKEDYAYDEDDREKVLIDDCNAWVENKKTELYRLKDDGTDFGYKVKHWFPLWTISDCLEYLEIECVPLKMQIKDDSYARLQGWRWRVSWGNPNTEEGKPWGGSINAPTLLEACLKVVLAVRVEGV